MTGTPFDLGVFYTKNMINKINPINKYPNIVGATIRDIIEDGDKRI